MKPLVLHHQVPRYTGQRLRWPAGLTHLPKAPHPVAHRCVQLPKPADAT